MMPAAKMMDPVLGIDIHIIQPPGPVPPVPIPHPFVGLLFDPMELAPFIGASVFVNGMPKATAGSEGKALPPHIPIGGIFVPPPPGNECEMFMGSATVLFEGEPASYLALPALSCQSIGMPAPFRPKKKPKPILKLPTSVVLPIPAGPPVLIGGPPTISMTVIGMKLAMGAAMKAAGKLRKMMKASKKVKAVSDRIHKAAKKAMDKLGVPPSAQNKVHKSICTVTGHPVDVATGKVFTEAIDFRIGGSQPVRWERTWYSSSQYRGPLGYGWHHPYDLALVMDEKVVAIRLPDGRPVAFRKLKVGESQHLRSEKSELIRDEEGYAYRMRGGLIYRFAGPAQGGIHPVTRIESPAGNPLLLEHDASGRLQAIDTGAGRRLTFLYDWAGRIVEIRGHADSHHPEGSMILARYRYDEHGDLVEAVDPSGKAWHYRYRDHLLVRESNRNGLSFHFEYEQGSSGPRCTRTFGDGGLLERKLAYDAAGKRTTVTDTLGHVTVHRWNDEGLVVETTDARGGVSRIHYNEFNEVVEEIDALGLSMRYEFDERGNCTAVRSPDGAVLVTEFLGDLPISASDSLGGRHAWEYDAAGNLIRKTDPLGRETRFEYRGPHLARCVEANGGETTYAYDAHGNLVEMRQPDGVTLKWRYDWLGRCVEAVDPSGNAKRRTFDACGRMARSEEPDGNVRILEYDGEGNVVLAKDGRKEVRFEYRGLNRIAAREEAGTRIEFRYDSEDRLLAIRNELGDLHAFELDANGDVEAETDFLGAGKRFTRDARGRILRMERSGGRITKYGYDAGDRLVSVYHGEDYRETREYRSDGLLMSAENPAAKVVFERDLLGRVTRESIGDFWVASTYDASGDLIGLESSLGHRLSLARNLVGECTEMEATSPAGLRWKAAFRRDDWGRELERSLPGGLKSLWKRDKLGRPEVHKLWSPIQSRQRDYAWQFDERLEEIQDTSWGSTKFGYDPAGNLIWALGEQGWARLRIADEVGNIYGTESRTDRKYGPGGQLLETTAPDGAVQYAYDAEGNLVRKTGSGGTWTYRWDPAGRLASAQRPDGNTASFTYDPLGRRLSKTFGGVTTRWIWNDATPLHEWEEPARGHADAPASSGIPARDSRGTGDDPITWIFVPGTHTPAAKLVGNTVYSILADHLGTPVSMSDSEGREVWSAKLDPYGMVEVSKGPRLACPFRFPGQFEDGETGLYYNRYRYYDPGTGRYISKDPIGLAGGLRPYAYVSDPNMWVDYFGLAFQRPYSQPEVSQVLDDSEGRPSPTTGEDGHPRGRHAGKSNDYLRDRVKPGGGGPQKASTFESAQSQDRAATQALNSPEGQAKLAELDSDPTKKRVAIEADTGPETMRHAQRNRGYIVRENSRKTVVVVDVLDRTPGAERIHVQTCVPK